MTPQSRQSLDDGFDRHALTVRLEPVVGLYKEVMLDKLQEKAFRTLPLISAN